MICVSHPAILKLPSSEAVRSRGIHVSSIIRCIATETGILKPEWAEELSLVDVRTITDQIAITRMCMGLAWEEWYIRTQLAHVVDHPGEMRVDGIYMTHDGESLDVIITDNRPKHSLRIHEVKLTYKSTNTTQNMDADISSNFMWLAQTKAYCKGANTLLADLHALYVCGDYSYPIQPIPMVHHLEFTQQEIEDNWDLLREYRDQKIEKGQQ